MKKTGISAITGKTVVIRHATEWDMVFTEENLKKNDLDTTGLQAYQFAVAAEKSDLIGFGGLRKTGDVYDIGCVVVAEKRRNRGGRHRDREAFDRILAADKVYVATNVVDYFLKPGFTETSTNAGETESRPRHQVQRA